MNNNNKLMFFMMMILSSMMMMMSNYWLNMWIWLEINLISFIFMMMNYKNYLMFESSLIYFLIQSLASILFIYSIIFSVNKFIMIILMISLMLKLSIAPLHFWMPMMVESLNWMIIFLLLTWQKLGPLILMNYLNFNNKFMIFMFFSLLIGSIMGLNYSSIKKIMAYSSINQMSWMMISLMLFNKIFKLYLLIYFYLMMLLIYSFKLNNLNFIYQFFKLKMKNFKKMFLFTNLLSLGGLPPFLGFFPKMLIIMKSNNSLILFFMIMFTLITLFFYIRIMISMMILNSLKMMNKNNKLNLNKNKMIMNLSLINNFFMIYILMLN